MLSYTSDVFPMLFYTLWGVPMLFLTLWYVPMLFHTLWYFPMLKNYRALLLHLAKAIFFFKKEGTSYLY